MVQANKVDGQQLEDPPTMKFTWKIEDFTKLKDEKLYSDVFTVGGYKWRILVYPKGNKVDFLSIYLDLADWGTLPKGGRRYAQFSLAVINQINAKDSRRESLEHEFDESQRQSDWGLASFMALYELYDTPRGYLMNDIVVIEAVIAVPMAVCPTIPAIVETSQSEEDAKHPHEMQTDDRILGRLSAAKELVMSTSAIVPSAEALAALDTISLYAKSSLDSLGKEGAYEEFSAALDLLIEQGVIPIKITSMLNDLLKSLEGELPKYLTTVEELAQGDGALADRREKMKIEMELAIEKCEEKKDNVAELDAELARINAKRAEAMGKLKNQVDEMEPLKQRFADISSKFESFVVKQAVITAHLGTPLSTWDAVKVLLKNCFKF